MEGYEVLTGDAAKIATLQFKLKIATARSTWGSKAQRRSEAEKADLFARRLEALGVAATREP